MKPTKDNELDTAQFECAEDFKSKKMAIEKRQNKTLSELGKTVAELKKDASRLNRLPED